KSTGWAVTPPATVPMDVCAVGTKNWPPARKLARWPLRATRFGSARILSRLLRRRALIISSKFERGKMPKVVVVPATFAAAAVAGGGGGGGGAAAGQPADGLDGAVAQRRAEAGLRVGEETDDVGPDGARGGAVQLGHANLEQHLLRGRHSDQVDDLRPGDGGL